MIGLEKLSLQTASTSENMHLHYIRTTTQIASLRLSATSPSGEWCVRWHRAREHVSTRHNKRHRSAYARRVCVSSRATLVQVLGVSSSVRLCNLLHVRVRRAPRWGQDEGEPTYVLRW